MRRVRLISRGNRDRLCGWANNEGELPAACGARCPAASIRTIAIRTSHQGEIFVAHVLRCVPAAGFTRCSTINGSTGHGDFMDEMKQGRKPARSAPGGPLFIPWKTVYIVYTDFFQEPT